MTIRKVLRVGHPLIRAEARAVDESAVGSRALERLIEDMFETMRDEDGVGLAAPQVQEGLRLFVYEVDDNPRYPDQQETTPPRVVINPRIVARSDRRVADWEGCLSLPDLRGRVERHRWVRLEGLNREGKPFERRVEGLEARVVQHELDHLNGHVYVDRMESMESLSFLEEFRRYRRPRKPDRDADAEGSPDAG